VFDGIEVAIDATLVPAGPALALALFCGQMTPRLLGARERRRKRRARFVCNLHRFDTRGDHDEACGTTSIDNDKTMKVDFPSDPATLVEEYLRVMMIPDPERARGYIGPDLEITFTGGRVMRDPAECAAFNAARYAWVKKRFEHTHVVAGGTLASAIVYATGTLFGAWPDGTAFEGNRYVDRYTVRDGRIVRMEVWNDSAELLLMRLGAPK
jgi:ketosteroid isomerase-like protein